MKRSLGNLETSGYLIREGDELYEITEEGYVRAEREAAAAASSAPKLGSRAIELLKAGVKEHGQIMHMVFSGGEEIHAGGKGFIGNDSPRSAAEWSEGLEELVEEKLVVARSKALYEVTAAGYRMAEQLGAESSATVQNDSPVSLQ